MVGTLKIVFVDYICEHVHTHMLIHEYVDVCVYIYLPPTHTHTAKSFNCWDKRGKLKFMPGGLTFLCKEGGKASAERWGRIVGQEEKQWFKLPLWE